MIYKKEIKVGRAWIVTTESANRKFSKKVISVLKYQKSEDQMAEHITQLYVDQHLIPSEKISFLKSSGYKGIAYHPRVTRKNRKTIVTIGHMMLGARQVKNLRVTRDNKRRECFEWDELK